MNHIEISLPADTRIDQSIYSFFSGNRSRSFLQQCIRDGLLKTTSGEALLKPGLRPKQEIMAVLELPDETTAELTLQPGLDVEILYEDEDLAVIIKPAGMTVHPGAGQQHDTLVHALYGKIQLAETGDPMRPGIVHRIDRDTEGLLLIAKNRTTHWQLSRLFADRQVDKLYHTFLTAPPPKNQDTITGIIQRDKRDRKKMAFSFDLDSPGKVAELSYELLKKQHLEVKLLTGRTHQIRATFKALGCPVIGDKIYGKENERGLLLFARHLGFKHPASGKLLQFSLPDSERYKQAVRSFGS